MIIVSDATPIISLAKLDMVNILGRFYNEILLPKAVFDEVCCNPAFATEAEAVQKCPFICVTNRHIKCNRKPYNQCGCRVLCSLPD